MFALKEFEELLSKNLPATEIATKLGISFQTLNLKVKQHYFGKSFAELQRSRGLHNRPRKGVSHL